MIQPSEPKNESRSIAGEFFLVLALLAVIILLLILFFRQIMIPYIKLEMRHDYAGAQELLCDRGFLGFFAVTLVEALQMVVVFIPAEFIQITSGLSYPFYIALLLCDLGVCLGATIIFALVRVFRYHSSAFEKSSKRIDMISHASKQRNTVLFMYLLFFMPIIPFGAICYYGSGTTLSYGKYIRTVATGVIPSIIVSNLIGEAGMAFLVNDFPMWLLVLVIVFLAAVLFAVIYVFLDRFFFKESDGTPDSPVYALIFFLCRLFQGRSPRLVIEEEELSKADAPYIMLSNHESFFDFNYIHKMSHPRPPAFLINNFYVTRPVLKTLKRKSGMMGKKLFTPDLGATVSIMRTLRNGFPVVIFPEGRLSPDGRSNPIVEEGAAFYKRLGVDLVLIRIHGAYYAGPKWRKRRYHSDTCVRVTVERVIKRDELQAMPDPELNSLITSSLYNDASAESLCSYHQKDKAEGLEGLLYRCPDCGKLYTMSSKGNSLYCRSCGSIHTLDENYRFTTAPYTIPAWYDIIREFERKELDSFRLDADVRTVIYPAAGGPPRKETGNCRLDPETFSYHSETADFSIPTEKLPALAFSCSKEFELYFNNEQYFFYPVEHPEQAARWALFVDLLSERRRNERDASCSKRKKRS